MAEVVASQFRQFLKPALSITGFLVILTHLWWEGFTEESSHLSQRQNLIKTMYLCQHGEGL
ncbi:Uncharacterised protein [Klebsiella pneumoniae]|nr:Uncharacterised protein [Klebsiella pneumoniae]SAU23873.1 Uncharacterised protein [Klebsiella pneumoniae]VGH53572.1 Uncharacterised protein [Klebsiella pneumoniae]VGL00209.1 Uncharacterised protein [Klebsiella pneumoniae]